MFCERYCLVKWNSYEIIVQPLKCRTWACDECQPGRKARLIFEAKSGRPNRFITLTSKNQPGLTPSQAAQDLVTAWRTIRRQYMKKHGKGSLAFLAVFEETKRGWPHLHIVCRSAWISQKWLSKRMRELTGSPVVDIRQADGTGKVAHYISKYIGKNPHRFAGTKRYWRSQDYILPSNAEELASKDTRTEWSRQDMPAAMYCKSLEPYFAVHDVHRGQITLRRTTAPDWPPKAYWGHDLGSVACDHMPNWDGWASPGLPP